MVFDCMHLVEIKTKPDRCYNCGSVKGFASIAHLTLSTNQGTLPAAGSSRSPEGPGRLFSKPFGSVCHVVITIAFQDTQATNLPALRIRL
jgi:hypothetical protein